jgi:hypothetical protein
MFHKNLWDELHKERRRREEVGLEEDEPKKLIGTKGSTPRTRYWSKTSHQRSVAFRWRKSPHEDRLECLG